MVRFGIRLFALFLVALLMTSQASAQEKKADTPSAKETPAKEASAKGKTHKVKQEPLRIEVNLTGIFEADKMWPVVLRPENWSSLDVLKAVRHGQPVKKGETLVWLDMAQIDEKLQDLENEMQLSELAQELLDLDLKLLKITTPMDLELAERTHRIAGEDLRYFLEVSRDQQVKSAQFSLRSSRESLEYAQEELKQLEKMYKADDLTEETEEIVLKRARNDVKRSEYYLESAELRSKKSIETELPRQEEQVRETARRAEIALAKAKETLPTKLKKQAIEREKQAIAYKRAARKRDEVKKDRSIMAVTSPADGYVYYGQCKRGKWPAADSVASQLQLGGKLTGNNVFMAIVAPRPVHVRTDVPEKELHRLKKGLKGKAIPNGFPNMELNVTVQHVSPFPIATGIFDGHLNVVIGEDAQVIVPGMGCKLTLLAYEKKNAITVPASAVFEDKSDGQQNVVYVAKADGTSEKRKIVVGQKTDKKWEVVQGLAAGDEILLKEPDAT